MKKAICKYPICLLDTLFWRDYGFQEIKDSIEMQETSINTNIAKNIILFIGDGMSNPTISAARILKGIQEKNPYPERGFLSFERFPHLGRIKVWKEHFVSLIKLYLNASNVIDHL